MRPEFSDTTTLFQAAVKELLYEKLVAQLQKDFTLANVDIGLSPHLEPTQVKTLLQEKIYYLILEKFDEYLNLLYIIDVPEKVFKEVKVTDVVEVAEQVSFLILQRELQKVRLKAKYL